MATFDETRNLTIFTAEESEVATQLALRPHNKQEYAEQISQTIQNSETEL
jgi:hypothetical protein